MIELTRDVRQSSGALGRTKEVLADLTTDLVTLTMPWHLPFVLEECVTPGRRTLVVSRLGFFAGHWCDGPLAHVLENGRIASYVPSGGDAVLKIPERPPQGGSLTFAEAQELEGTVGARSQRCLLGYVDAHMHQLGAAPWRLPLQAFDLRHAVALVLLRQASPSSPVIAVPHVSRVAVPPSWRRLLQNVGIWLEPAGSDGPGRSDWLEAFCHEIPTLALPGLAAQLNLLSDVLPRKFLEEAPSGR